MKTIETFYVARYYLGEIEGIVAGPFCSSWNASDEAARRSFHERDNDVDYGMISTTMNYED